MAGDETDPQVVDRDVVAKLARGRATPEGQPPTPLSYERVVRTAIALIDDRGVGQLTMRRMASALGVEAMSLYHWVPNREALLDAVIESVVGELFRSPMADPADASSWQDFVSRLAHGIRDAALAHPRVFPLLVTQPAIAPWVRPPLRSLLWVQTFLHGLVSRGFTDESAVTAYRSFTSLLLGHLLLEVAELDGDFSPLPRSEPALDDELLERFPDLARMREQLAENHAQDEFADTLDQLIMRMELMLPGQ